MRSKQEVGGGEVVKLLKVVNEWINRFLEWFLIVGFVGMTLIIFLQVIFRYFLLQSLSWSEEIARYLFIWLTFLGASVVARSRSHITVESLANSVRSPLLRKSLKTVATVLTLMFLYVLVTEGFIASFEILELEQVSPSMPWLALGWIYFAIPIGSLFMGLNLLEQMIDLWQEKNCGKEHPHG